MNVGQAQIVGQANTLDKASVLVAQDHRGSSSYIGSRVSAIVARTGTCGEYWFHNVKNTEHRSSIPYLVRTLFKGYAKYL